MSLSGDQTTIVNSDPSLMKAEAYFLSICTHGRQLSLGQIKDGQMILNARGSLVEEEWLRTAENNQDVELDAYVVMPNHFHAIFWFLAETLTAEKSEITPDIAYGTNGIRTSVEDVIQSFKAAVTDRAQRLFEMPDTPFWQPSFHAHRIRQRKALPSLRKYISDNPADWSQDGLNPDFADPSCSIIPAPISR